MRLLLMVFFIYMSGSSGYAQHIDQKRDMHKVSDLFKEESVLKIIFSYSKNEILTETNDSTYIASDFSFVQTDGSIKQLASEIRARGNYRKSNCYFLPLWLKTNKEASQGTIFQDDKKVKLVLPCLKSSKANDHVLKEYLAYKIFELISPYHLESRLLDVQLKEDKNKKTVDHDLTGIFVQDDKNLATLYRGKLIKRHTDPYRQDPLSCARNALFQYMIGNTDFSIVYSHNIKLFYIDGKIVPVPFDFDMSGFVNVNYAVVSTINNKALPITKVTDRLYRGFDRDDVILQQIRNEFLLYEKDIFSLFDQHRGLFKDPKEFAECQKYISGFYKLIKDDKKFENRIIKRERTKLE